MLSLKDVLERCRSPIDIYDRSAQSRDLLKVWTGPAVLFSSISERLCAMVELGQLLADHGFGQDKLGFCPKSVDVTISQELLSGMGPSRW